MIFKDVSFWVHRQLLFGFIAISCMLITAEVETVDGSFVRVYLKLYCFEEFLDYKKEKSLLDLDNLVHAAKHIRQISQYRRDYFQLNLRQANWDECATEDEICWPHDAEKKRQFLQGDQWEHDFKKSSFASEKIHTWLPADFIISTMMFPLRSIMPYSKIYYYYSNANVNQEFIYINLGQGYEFVTDYQRYLNRKKSSTEAKVQHLALKCASLRQILGKRQKKYTNSISLWGNAQEQIRKKPKQIVIDVLRSGLLKD